MNIKLLLLCLVVMTMMAVSESRYAQPRRELRKRQAGSECAVTEDELDEIMGGLEEVALLIKQMEEAFGDMRRRR